MRLIKVSIKNFKSIKKIEFEIKKYGSSYTTMLLGVNESGKSNILKAMSFLTAPTENVDYQTYQNQKDEENKDIDISFEFIIDDKYACLKEVRDKIKDAEIINFEITNVKKLVWLENDQNLFNEVYMYKVKNLTTGLYIKKVENKRLVNGRNISFETIKISKTNEDITYVELTNDNFDEYFHSIISKRIESYQPTVTVWKPSPRYLISNEDLNEFVSLEFSKSSLKNIFILAGYKTDQAITAAIENIKNGQKRSQLKSRIETALNSYIKNVWNHHFDVVIDITETGILTLSIKDSGEENMHDRLPIDGRSEGARHFLSLILSLSIESENKQRKNQLILIDEPEAHLHPSGIRDLRKELLKIGIDNYLFVSTHSPFLVDRVNKERNIIIKKNNSAFTEKIIIDSDTDIIDDEVLREAFGLEVYKDLLNPHSILVEGASDKRIIKQMLNIKKQNGYGITNGHGSNIDTLASKLNDIDISLLVILDDDKEGRSYKQKIIRLGGSYSVKNVLTLKDLVSEIPEFGTIEDLLGKEYVTSIFKACFENHYINSECDIVLTEDHPFLQQMKKYLNKQGCADIDKFIEKVKDSIAEKLIIPKTTYKTNFPLLNTLTEAIVQKLS